MAEKGNQSDFLTTMSRDESDVLVVQKCCVVIGNIVASGIVILHFFVRFVASAMEFNAVLRIT